MRGSIIAALLLGILNLMDASITAVNISRHGIGVEMNPIMAWVITNFGYTGMFVSKLFFVLVLLYGLGKIVEERLQPFIVPALWYMCGAYTLVVYYGYRLLVF